MKIAVTGAEGFLGFHFRSHCLIHKEWQIMPILRRDFATEEALSKALQGCELVIHLAGVNRGEEAEVYQQNIAITKKLVAALEKNQSSAQVIFASSTHIFKNSQYGRAKKEAAEFLQTWAQRSGSRFTELILPHVFGEGGKPFYNSAVATFCYQLARSEPTKIISDAELELIHASDVCKLIFTAISERHSGRMQGTGRKIKVSEVLQKLQASNDSYRNLIIPELKSEFDLHLFNTYRSYLYPDYYPLRLSLRTDNRGSLFEFVKSDHGGQGFLSTTKPGVTRGNHYHYHKVERFCVAKGEAVIRIRKLFDSSVKEFKVSGNEPCYIDIPTLHTHNITNLGSEELITLFWAHEIFDTNRPDTFTEIV